MNPYIRLFGPAHLAILAAVPALAGGLAWMQRKLGPDTAWLRIALATLMLLNAAIYYTYLGFRDPHWFPEHLPIELCDVSLTLVILALFTRNAWAFDLAYYLALAGAGMALLTPNLWEPFPSFGTVEFFAVHALIVAGPLYLLWSGQMRPRRRSVARAMLAVNVYAIAVGAFDFVYGTDYMYLRAKPATASLFDYLGPWPWYLLSTEGVALVLFVLLYLPVRRGNATPTLEAEAQSARP